MVKYGEFQELQEKLEKINSYIGEILEDQNEINESTRAQLEAINTALAELQVEHRQQPKRKPIGFLQPKEDEELEEEQTCRKFRQVRQKGKRMVACEIPMYSLSLLCH